ncbi:thiol reductant ABC exporter subunit CydC [Geobacter pelophilus]|uniref:Thiol reductant ABC exporter subunit CydC n=1 Tax=Geoanaerobacter pelophilus TaxID=60036 RepID=A0AAW4KY81_9BACT|nr:thiol reductant ABC exporter subunit CydC [Geoanaerobacter pelophilus]MBT0662867.1 thiol reductant ABC exporter subunit CydC [Geoanaerobacter pelophilus]
MKDLATLFQAMASRQWSWLVAGIVAGILVIAANVTLMAVSGWFIASMAVAGVTKVAFNYAVPAAAIRGLALIRTLGRYAERLVTHEAAFRMLADLRSWMFERLIPLAPAGLEGYAGGDLSGRLRADVDNMESLYLRIVAPIATGFAVILLAPCALALFSPAAGLALFAALFAAGVVLPLATRKMAAAPGERSVQLAGELRTVVTEGLQGAEELLLLGASAEQAHRVELLYAGIVKEQRRLGSINGIVIATVTATGGIALAALLAIGATELSPSGITGPELVMMLLYAAASFEGVAPLAAALQAVPASAATAGRLNELATAPHPVPESAANCVPEGHEIVFRDVCFSYGAGAEVLNNFSLTIRDGSRVALTGRSGRGKSSIVELLLRFRPYRGSITIGGAELRDIDSRAVASLITAVPQRPHLFNSSIRDNILLGAPDADSNRIREALGDSGLAGWVDGLPDGLDTAVGVAGSAVSGGEAKRIALARSLLHDSPIFLLDEPTEGLDGETERMVVERLQRRLAGKTVLLISHRPACLALAERVIRI